MNDQRPPDTPAPRPRLGEIGLSNFAPYLMNRIMGRYNRSLRDELAALGLTTPKMRALAALSAVEGPLIRELAVYTVTEQSTLSRALDQLDAAGLIRRGPDANDSRATRVFITEAGRAAQESLWPRMHDAYDRMFRGIPDAERAAFIGTLQKILTNIRKHDIRGAAMAERSFKAEVQDLRKGAGDTFTGEGILALTKALLENGVGYVGGYQGAPNSHLMDVLADAQDLLGELGVQFEANANEAAAAAMLAASVHYPIRGAVTFKGPVGVNVASDALANLASSGVSGGAIIIVGEDYGEGSSIMQERTHAFAMKSQLWLMDPRPNLPSIVKAVGDAFELSEASNTPVILTVRIRACHVSGTFATRDNRRPTLTVAEAVARPQSDFKRVVLPPMSFTHEHEKINARWPNAERFIRERGLNEVFGPAQAKVGLVLQGGMYNGVIRALQRLGLADIFGQTEVPLYVLNVTYPLVPDEFFEFCEGKESIMVIEEGQPEFIEQALSTYLYRKGSRLRLHGKDILPMAGEYTGQVLLDSITAFLRQAAPDMLPAQVRAPNQERPRIPDLSKTVPIRPPGFCTGCPERPIFAALKLVQQELGQHQIAADIGCHLFGSLPPFEVGGQTMGYGLGPAANGAFDGGGDKRPISIIGEGGFWHNGLSSSFTNMAFNKSDGVAGGWPR